MSTWIIFKFVVTCGVVLFAWGVISQTLAAWLGYDMDPASEEYQDFASAMFALPVMLLMVLAAMVAWHVHHSVTGRMVWGEPSDELRDYL